MKITDFINLLLREFPYEATQSQRQAIDKIVKFLGARDRNPVFVLKGYAGTGKTTLVSALVKKLGITRTKPVLLAPTGRAAKVLSGYSGQKAFTIHKKIYRVAMDGNGSIQTVLSQNLHKNTVFIVDEASMIPDESNADKSPFASHRLLNDLISYVYSGENCRMILIGDSAQLPPVGYDTSPALDIEYLTYSYGLTVFSSTLTEIVRQSVESGILANATTVREKIVAEIKTPFLSINGYKDIIRVTGFELEEELINAFTHNDPGNAVVITRSNKRANIFNREIRSRILYREEELSAGDIMMVVKNNYFWLDNNSQAGFIANGDIIEILKVNNIVELYGFRFADVNIRLTDYPDEKDLNVKIMLDTVDYPGPSLSPADNKRLFEEVMEDYKDIPSYKKRLASVKKNPFFNALQVKFGYALTCHKTQGGQWPLVFIDQGYITGENLDSEFFRWLYTAFTRATDKLFLINFNEDFFF